MTEKAQSQVKQDTPVSYAPVAGGLLQRKCACGNHTPGGGECDACRKNRLGLQRKAAHSGEVSEVPPIVHEVLSSPGQPLDPATRAFMEPRFGKDFSQVRVHTDGRAAESARAINAVAYTAGRNVVFGTGQYSPLNPTGQLLIAHELTHVIQQNQHEGIPPTQLGSESAPQEHAANEAAARVLMNPDKTNSATPAGTVEPGTVQGGWPLIVAAGTGILGGAYAIWAYKCLKPLEIPMYNATFGDPVNREGGFRLWYYQKTNAPVPSNVWDAFGHCWIACASTKKCGSMTAAIAGKSREFYREHIDSASHDSYKQDTNNQTLGRGFGSKGEDCTVSCGNAALPGGSMDLSAPKADFWTPSAP